MLNRLKSADWTKLPGLDAQLLMAPPTRKEEVELIVKETKFQDSSVLILIFQENNEWFTLLIKRAIDGYSHSGQMAFPGGRFENSDINLEKTALRETHEEIGIPESMVQVLGKLSTMYIPVSGHRVIPYVGYMEKLPELVLDKVEVDSTFKIPIKDFQNPKSKKLDKLLPRNRDVDVPYYSIQNQVIWGATAMIIAEFLVFLDAN